MTKVNITPAMRKMTEAAGMYIEFDVSVQDMGEDSVSLDTVVIGEDSSDFYVEYLVCNDGTLNHYVSPTYVTGLPIWIETTSQLKQVVKYLIKACEDANS